MGQDAYQEIFMDRENLLSELSKLKSRIIVLLVLELNVMNMLLQCFCFCAYLLIGYQQLLCLAIFSVFLTAQRAVKREQPYVYSYRAAPWFNRLAVAGHLQ